MTTDQTTPTIDPAVAAEALTGPWQAVLAWRHGGVTTLEEFYANWHDADELNDLHIVVVRRTATPAGHAVFGTAVPGTYEPTDMAAEMEFFETFDDLAARWVQAQAMVAGLNAAAEATS